MNALICLLAVASSQGTETIHPAFDYTPKMFLDAWEKGYKEAEKKKDPNALIDSCRRGIGSIRTAPLRSETVSWFWLWHPKTVAYCSGFKARKQYWSKEEMDKTKAAVDEAGSRVKQVHITARLSIYPSFGAAYGRVSRHADPSDLKGVRVVMEIGSRVYQPLQHPGDLQASSGTSTNVVAIPQMATSRTTSSATGSAYGSDGSYAYGSAYGKSSTTYYYNVYRHEDWDWYQATFEAAFDLYESDGTPVIRKTDKEVTFIVIYGPNQRRATYKLADLEKLAK